MLISNAYLTTFVLVLFRVHEDTCLGDMLKTFLHPTESDPVKRQMLKSYSRTPVEDCKVLMQEEGLPANFKRSALPSFIVTRIIHYENQLLF